MARKAYIVRTTEPLDTILGVFTTINHLWKWAEQVEVDKSRIMFEGDLEEYGHVLAQTCYGQIWVTRHTLNGEA